MLFIRSLTAALCCAACTTAAHAQPASLNDEALIRATVNTYFDGWATSDTTKVSAAMHASCHLKLSRNGELVDLPKRTYLSGFKPRPAGEQTQARILTLHRTGLAAGVVTQIISGSNQFTDYFNLLKLNGRWYITDKIAYREALPAQPR